MTPSQAQWMRPGKRRELDKARLVEDLTNQLERLKVTVWAKVERSLRVVKRQFRHAKVRYRRLAKNTAQSHALFALSNCGRCGKR